MVGQEDASSAVGHCPVLGLEGEAVTRWIVPRLETLSDVYKQRYDDRGVDMFGYLPRWAAVRRP